MKLLGTVLLAAAASLSSAAPAIVWKRGTTSFAPSHVSDAIDAQSFLASIDEGDDSASSSALSAVIFLVGRDADGSEGLASLASSGKIPGVQKKYGVANEIHHHVHGVESSRTIARDAKSSGVGSNVAEVSVEEFARKLSSIATTENNVEEGGKVSKAEQKRRRAISEADVLIVNVSAKDAAGLDAAVVAAIDSKNVRNVVLSTIRSTDEVKRARKLAVAGKFTKKNNNNKKANNRKASDNKRRLEDEANNENNQNNQNANAQDDEGVYYVNMTPNIFAGLLFFFMFVFTAHLGLTCMNAIEGQDVYVKKMPHIGREV